MKRMMVLLPFLLLLVVACATTGRVRQTELKVAKLESFTSALNLDLGVARNDIRGIKEDLGITKGQLLEVTRATNNAINELKKADASLNAGLNEAKAELGATKSQLQEVSAKTEAGLNEVRSEVRVTKGQIQEVTSKTEAGLNGVKADLGATKNQLGELTQRVEKTDTGLNEVKSDIGATKSQLQSQLQEVTNKTDKTEASLSELKNQLQKEYKDLRAYAITLRKIIAEREAKHSYKADEVEGISIYLVGPFATGKAELNKSLEAGLSKVLADLESKQSEISQIHGFASVLPFAGKSPEESEKLNKELSFGRAKVIQAWFKGKGLDIPDEKVLGLGGVVKFGMQLDNQCAVIFAKPKPAAPPTPPPTKP